LIDAYGEGLLDKHEFEPRIRSAKDVRPHWRPRLVRKRSSAQEQELRLVITRLQEFAAQVHDGLHTADWQGRVEVVRALVRRVEVDEKQIR